MLGVLHVVFHHYSPSNILPGLLVWRIDNHKNPISNMRDCRVL
jgi:hypothetical protein